MQIPRFGAIPAENTVETTIKMHKNQLTDELFG